MRLLLIVLMCLLAVGCRSDARCSRQTALLRAEILDLEDKYYLLKSKHENTLLQKRNGNVESYADGELNYQGDEYYDGMIIPGDDGIIYEGEVFYDDGGMVEGDVIYDNGVVDQDVYNNGGIYGADESSLPAESGNDVRSIVQPPAQPEMQNSLPRVEPGETEPLPAPNSDPNQSNLLLNPPGSRSSSDIEVAFPRLANNDSVITEIVINKQTTRGRDVDGIPGHEGIDLLIQPKTADGQIEYQTGELTISVIDPEASPDRQRIGLWKFLPDETKLFFANDELGSRGILLHLPWDQSTPVNERLVIHVRMVTADGRVLKTSSPIRIKSPQPEYSADDPLVAGWTQQDSRWISESPSETRSERGSDWRRRSTVPAKQASTARPSSAQPARRLIPAIPAKAEINKPTWRPIR